MLETCFARAVCINLDRRPDRWEAMQRKFAAENIAAERLPAIDSKTTVVPAHLAHMRPQDYACTMSHLAAVRQAKADGIPNVLIFEDDAFFGPDFAGRFTAFFAQLPADWDMLFLGAYHFEKPVPVASNVVRIVKALTAHAYAVRASVFDAFIEINGNPPAIVDRNNTVLQRRFNCYCFEPNLVGQEAGYSDLMDEEMPEKPISYPIPPPGAW